MGSRFATWMRIVSAAASVVTVTSLAQAEPSEPVLIGWWSYFAPESDASKVPTTTNPSHVVDHFGDPDTYYYEPSGGHGMQEDPSVLPPDQAWQTMISYILAQADQFTLPVQHFTAVDIVGYRWQADLFDHAGMRPEQAHLAALGSAEM